MVGFSDADWAGDVDSRRSTNRFFVTVNRTAVAWDSKKQSIKALLSCEAEYVTLLERIKLFKWLKMMLTELHLMGAGPILLYENNRAAIVKDSQAFGY